MSRNVSKQIIKNYTKLSEYKSSLSFHKIPYHLQYECRDFNTKTYEKPSIKTLMSREKYVKEFNPYLSSNVSENLDQKLVKFYREKYIKR